MKIDLHIHSKDCSDGKMTLSQIFYEACKNKIEMISITDHDSIDCQESAIELAENYGMRYVTGVELNISFSHTAFKQGKAVSLDALGYQFDIHNEALINKLKELRQYRQIRAKKMLDNLNIEFEKESLPLFSSLDMNAIEETVDGAFGRPHIADYLIKKGLVGTKQEAFDKYLVKCNVSKLPVSLKEASELIRGAKGKLVLAHPNDPNGTSLASLTSSIDEQLKIIKEKMLPFIDGLECWHSRHDQRTISTYTAFAREEGLIITGGSDCHQQPVIMGRIAVPAYVADQF